MGFGADVRSKVGVPVAADFAGSDGTPLVIDLTANTGWVYYLNAAGTVIKGGSISATNRLLGRASAGSGSVEEITVAGDLVQSGSALTIASKTGTGSTFATNTSPTLITPVLGAASATSVSFSSTTGVIGTTTNDNAAAGSVGDFQSSLVTSGSPVTATNNTAIDITSKSLTAGDWDVWGNVNMVTAGTNPTIFIGWLSQTSATLPDQSLYAGIQASATTVAIAAGTGFAAPGIRVSIASTQTVYLSTYCSNSVGNSTVCGNLYARRRR